MDNINYTAKEKKTNIYLFIHWKQQMLTDTLPSILIKSSYKVDTTNRRTNINFRDILHRMCFSIILKPSKDSCGDTLLFKLHLCEGQEQKEISATMFTN